MASTEKTAELESDVACAICGKPPLPEGQPGFPFCSPRCQLVDLGRWLDEGYRIPDDTPDVSE